MDPSRYGCNSHVAPDQVLDTLGAAGISWHRIDVDWDRIEPLVRGLFEWDELDRVVAAANQRNLSLLASIAYTPMWASGVSERAAPPRVPQHFTEFVVEVVRRYRGRIQAVSVWNEPNLPQFWHGSRDQYIYQILCPALQAIRFEAREMVTAGPDLSSSGRPLDDWLPRIMDATAGMLDVLTHHQYNGHDSLPRRIEEIERLERRFLTDKRLWITEIGWDHVAPDVQGDLLVGVMTAMRERPWWDKTFWYDSHGPHWGLLEDDLSDRRWQPKPAYFAYRDVIGQG